MPKWIKPKRIPIGEIDRRLRFALEQAGAIVRADYQLFTATWEHDSLPEWHAKAPRKVGRDLIWDYWTDSTPFIYVELGTEPHTIRARFAPMLKFQTGFIAKTKPRQLMSGPGARFGDWASKLEVQHPGNEPRNVSIEIAKRVQPYLVRYIAQAIRW